MQMLEFDRTGYAEHITDLQVADHQRKFTCSIHGMTYDECFFFHRPEALRLKPAATVNMSASYIATEQLSFNEFDHGPDCCCAECNRSLAEPANGFIPWERDDDPEPDTSS